MSSYEDEFRSGRMLVALQLLISALNEDQLSASHPDCFAPWDRPSSTQCTGGWPGFRTGLEAVDVRNMSFPEGKLNPGRPTRSQSLYRIDQPHFMRKIKLRLNDVSN
jgi:hypothetical protein